MDRRADANLNTVLILLTLIVCGYLEKHQAGVLLLFEFKFELK